MPQPSLASGWGIPGQAWEGKFSAGFSGAGMISAALGFHDDLHSIPGARTAHACTPQDAATWDIEVCVWGGEK